MNSKVFFSVKLDMCDFPNIKSHCKFKGFAVTLQSSHKRNSSMMKHSENNFTPSQSVALLCYVSVTITNSPLKQAVGDKENTAGGLRKKKTAIFFFLLRLKRGKDAPLAHQDAVTGDSVRPFNTAILCQQHTTKWPE